MLDASDEALLAGLAADDHDAALVFVRRWQRRVYGLALVILRDAGQAEDVAQEAFVRAWRHASTYDARRGSVATWLLAITRNLAIDATRVARVRPAAPYEPMTLMLAAGPDGSAGPDAHAAETDEIRRVRDVLRTLPDEQRRAVLLAALHGRTAHEISDIEGIPLGTAKTRIRTALRRLRGELISESP